MMDYITVVDNVTHYDSNGNYMDEFEKGTKLNVKNFIKLGICEIAVLDDDTTIISKAYKHNKEVIKKVTKKNTKK